MPPTRHSWRWPDADHPSHYREGRRLESRPLPHDREPPPFMPLVIKAIEDGPSGLRAVSVAPYGEQNGDLMRDSGDVLRAQGIRALGLLLPEGTLPCSRCLHLSTDVGSSWFLDAMIEASDFDKSVPRQGQRGRRPSAGQVLARLLAIRFAKRDSPGSACERISDIRQIGDPRRISNCDARVPFSPRAGNAERSGTNQYHFRPPPAAPGR